MASIKDVRIKAARRVSRIFDKSLNIRKEKSKSQIFLNVFYGNSQSDYYYISFINLEFEKT